jgi:hypothetical protein
MTWTTWTTSTADVRAPQSSETAPIRRQSHVGGALAVRCAPSLDHGAHVSRDELRLDV